MFNLRCTKCEMTSLPINIESFPFYTSICFKGTLLYLYLNTKYAEKVRGLCGNFNGATQDDTTGRDGVIDATSFSDSWRTDTSCAVVDSSLAGYDPCEAHVSHTNTIRVIE